MEEGRAKVTAGGDSTGPAAAGSRSSEAEVELLSEDVSGQRGTEDTVVAGSGVTRKATAAAQSARTKRNLCSVEEKDRRKIEEEMKQLPLEVVKAPKWEVIFSHV